MDFSFKMEERVNVKLPKNWAFFVIIAIILLGGYLRLYHIDYPAIGYHNWKEAHYLTEARNFAQNGFFEHGFFVPELDFPTLDQDPTGAHHDTFPMVSVLAAIGFKIFGLKLSVARMVGILSTLLAIYFMYKFVKVTWEREDYALVTAFLMSIAPLFVFFSHNVQLINPGLMFMTGGMMFYGKWLKLGRKGKHLILASLFISLAVLTKYTFGIIAVPILFTFPFKEYFSKWKENKKEFRIVSFFISWPILWFIYDEFFLRAATEGSAAGQSGLLKLIDVSVLFTAQWYNILKNYIADNYTMIGFYFAIAGLVMFCIFYKKNNIGMKFTMGYLIGFVLFVIIMAQKLDGHSYHQYPIAPFVLMMCAFFIVVVAQNVEAILKNTIKFRTRYLFIALLIFLLWSPAIEAKNRQFDTQFPGLDIAGEFIKENSNPDERIFYSNGQTYGLLWHADRKGHGAIPVATEIMRGEEELNFRWIYVYVFEMGIANDPARWTYISQNYRLRQIALHQQNNQLLPFHLVLEKGGNFSINDLNELLANRTQQSKEYERTYGAYSLSYINLP